MKQEVRPAILAGAIFVMALVVGVISWLTLRPVSAGQGELVGEPLKAYRERQARNEAD